MTTNRRRVGCDALRALVASIFERNGVPIEHAQRVADALVSADARGVTSHGVMRVPQYLTKIRAGGFKVDARARVVNESAATLLIDGGDGIGQVIAHDAMRAGIEKAKRQGACLVGVRRSNHFGEGAYYALQAVREDMIALVTTSASPNTPPYGGRSPVAGNLPLTVGVPAGKELPVLLDIAMCASSKGKVAYAAKEGVKIPMDWGVDREGRPTDDPQAILDGGWLLPIGGYKGWGIIVILDILSSVLTGGKMGTEITDLFEGAPSEPQGLGHFMMVIDVESFMPVDEFKARMDARIRSIKSARRLEGVDEILMPGERELRAELRAREHGIELIEEVLDRLKEEADRVGIPFSLQ